MTADRYLVIRCDYRDPDDEQCSAEGHYPVRLQPDTRRELRRVLKQERGWRRTRDGRDLCPDHAAA